MTRHSPPWKGFWIDLVGMLLIFTILLLGLHYLDPGAQTRHERIDTLAPGPYVVSAVKHHREVYLIETTTDNGAPALPADWSPMLEHAKRFATWDDAWAEAQRTGGRVLALREVRRVAG